MKIMNQEPGKYRYSRHLRSFWAAQDPFSYLLVKC